MTVTWRRHPAALWRRAGDKVIVLCSGRDEPLLLEGSGQLAWDLLAHPLELTELVARLSGLFDSDPELVAGDLRPFLEELEAQEAVMRS